MKAVGSHVVIEKLKTQTTASGVALPSVAKKNRQKGKIISVGDEVYEPETLESKTVIYTQNPDFLMYEDDDYAIVDNEGVLAIIE